MSQTIESLLEQAEIFLKGRDYLGKSLDGVRTEQLESIAISNLAIAKAVHRILKSIEFEQASKRSNHA